MQTGAHDTKGIKSTRYPKAHLNRCGKHAFKCSGHATLKLKRIVFIYIFSLPALYWVGGGFS